MTSSDEDVYIIPDSSASDCDGKESSTHSAPLEYSCAADRDVSFRKASEKRDTSTNTSGVFSTDSDTLVRSLDGLFRTVAGPGLTRHMSSWSKPALSTQRDDAFSDDVLRKVLLALRSQLSFPYNSFRKGENQTATSDLKAETDQALEDFVKRLESITLEISRLNASRVQPASTTTGPAAVDVWAKAHSQHIVQDAADELKRLLVIVQHVSQKSERSSHEGIQLRRQAGGYKEQLSSSDAKAVAEFHSIMSLEQQMGGNVSSSSFHSLYEELTALRNQRSELLRKEREMLAAKIDLQRTALAKRLDTASVALGALYTNHFEGAASGRLPAAVLKSELSELEILGQQLREVVNQLHIVDSQCSIPHVGRQGALLPPPLEKSAGAEFIDDSNQLKAAFKSLQEENRSLRAKLAEATSELNAQRQVQASSVELTALRRVATEFNTRHLQELRVVGQLFGWQILSIQCSSTNQWTLTASVGGSGPERTFSVVCADMEETDSIGAHPRLGTTGADLAASVEVYKEFQAYYNALTKRRKEEQETAAAAQEESSAAVESIAVPTSHASLLGGPEPVWDIQPSTSSEDHEVSRGSNAGVEVVEIPSTASVESPSQVEDEECDEFEASAPQVAPDVVDAVEPVSERKRPRDEMPLEKPQQSFFEDDFFVD